jgi:hypothetical protein
MATRRTVPASDRSSRTAIAAGAAVVLVLLSGCSSSGESDDAGSSSVAAARSDAEVAAAPAGAEAADGTTDLEAGADVAQVAGQEGGQPGDAAAEPQVGSQQVISTGDVQLRADDVGQAVFDVRQVVDQHRGEIAEDDTETDEKGAALRSRMVLRIPTADFGDTMAELEGVATLVSSTRQTDDVTTEVLDTDVRVEAQKRSIERIQALYARAGTIAEVVSLEAELSRRQADLASLEAQQRYLADQTSLSTITLSLERTPAAAKPEPRHDTDDAGFLTGFSAGWKALSGFLVALSTVVGALLPWLLLGLVLAVPGWPLARRLRRRPADAASLPA